MTWTTVAPTELGWYWWRRLKGDRTVKFAVVIEVVRINGKLFMSDTGDLSLATYAQDNFKNGVKKNEWAGPILPPNEAQP